MLCWSFYLMTYHIIHGRTLPAVSKSIILYAFPLNALPMLQCNIFAHQIMIHTKLLELWTIAAVRLDRLYVTTGKLLWFIVSRVR